MQEDHLNNSLFPLFQYSTHASHIDGKKQEKKTEGRKKLEVTSSLQKNVYIENIPFVTKKDTLIETINNQVESKIHEKKLTVHEEKRKTSVIM